MSSSGPSRDDYGETLALFDQRDDPTEPLTTPEIADSLETARETVYKRLENLVSRGKLKSKDISADARVWWRPHTDSKSVGVSEAEITESIVRQLFENAPNPYLIVQPDEYEIVAVSDTYLEATMTERETILGQTLFEVFPADPEDPDPEGAPRLRRSLDRVTEQREEDVMPVTHYPVPDRDATNNQFEDRWWSPVNTPLFDARGKLLYIIHHVQDVTPLVETSPGEDGVDLSDELEVEKSHLTADMLLKSRKLYEAREEAYEREKQQQAVADLGQVTLESSDLDALMNEAARTVADALDAEYSAVFDLETNAEALLLRQGAGWDEGVVGNTRMEAVEAESQAAYTLENDYPIVVEDLHTETRFSGQALLTNHDVRSGINTVIGPCEDPWGILSVHDPEPREFSEDDVSFVVSVANILAEAIEREQYETRLERLIRKLEESNERLEQFAYAASHDLQEPLRMVTSYLKLVESRYSDELDEDGEEFIKFAVDGAERMRAMINSLLAYSRVETQGDPFETVDLDVVVKDALADLQFRIDRHDAEVVVGELPVVRGDGGQLRQVFQNLLDNAIEYSGEKTPSVEVSAERDGNEWVISVADEGIGIDEDDAERVFEVFQRLHSREAHSGTGIGLALCDRIIERHNGDIWIESESSEGATFSMSLPPVPESESEPR
ncbi:PAS domain-containing sensor histidine kinase [Halobacterium wangiae]|uniref:PAS domain-containing sensor histidine kinase n=1 Tax=Halobacterium wangiae TaxID=2902623 RepID=UPI001E2CD9B4|nr:ATP-binding protein [Halobacterium wangiae]